MPDSAPPSTSVAIPRRSWFVLGLLFAAAFLNYFDRQTLSILKATLKGELGLTDVDYSHLITAFMVPYIFAYVVGGRLVGRWGTRLMLALFLLVWSAGNAICGFASGLGVLMLGRMLLGLAEPGCFPAMQQAIMTRFPRERRGFAMSLGAPATVAGAIAAPPLVAWMTARYDWHGAFILPGVAGIVLALVWWCTDRNPPDFVSAEEAAAPPPPWRDLLRDRRLLGLIVARSISDPVWYFHLFWLPGYFQESLGLTLSQLGWVGWIPSAVGALAVVCGGRLTDWLAGRGVEPARARMRLLWTGALLTPFGALTTFAPNIGVAVLLVCIVTIGCQFWFFGSGVLLADIYPRNTMSAAFGLVGACGASMSLLMNLVAGPVIQNLGYRWVFLALAGLHLLAAFVLSRALRRSPSPSKA